MTKIPYEIPAEISDLTAKRVEEARKAFLPPSGSDCASRSAMAISLE